MQSARAPTINGVERVHMRNDGRCAALAERHFGVGAGGEHAVLAMLTLGTGIARTA